MWFLPQHKTQRTASPLVRLPQRRLQVEALEERSLPNNLFGLFDGLPDGFLADPVQDAATAALFQQHQAPSPRQLLASSLWGDNQAATLHKAAPAHVASGSGSGSGTASGLRAGAASPLPSPASATLGGSAMDVTLLGQLAQKAGQPGHHPTRDAKGSGGGSGHSPGAG